jgi:hypothetical protein
MRGKEYPVFSSQGKLADLRYTKNAQSSIVAKNGGSYVYVLEARLVFALSVYSLRDSWAGRSDGFVPV